jgi:hypothetical protein
MKGRTLGMILSPIRGKMMDSKKSIMNFYSVSSVQYAKKAVATACFIGRA